MSGTGGTSLMALETVLVAVGNGDPERDIATERTLLDVAGPTGARVVLAHVFEESEYHATLDRFGLEPGINPTAVAERHSRVRELTRRLEGTGIDTEVRGAVGPRVETLVTLADTVDADSLFVGGTRRSPAGKAVFGSTAQGLLLRAPCPVVYTRDDLFSF